jgi:hypothetical protein
MPLILDMIYCNFRVIYLHKYDKFEAVLWLRFLDAGFSPRFLSFNSGQIYIKFFAFNSGQIYIKFLDFDSGQSYIKFLAFNSGRIYIKFFLDKFLSQSFPVFPHSSPFRLSSILIYLLPRTRAVTLTRQNISYSRFLSWKLYF